MKINLNELYATKKYMEQAQRSFEIEVTRAFMEIAKEKGSNDLSIDYYITSPRDCNSDVRLTRAHVDEEQMDVVFSYIDDYLQEQVLYISDLYPEDVMEIVNVASEQAKPLQVVNV